MKYTPINGWTKARIKDAIQTRMLDRPSFKAAESKMNVGVTYNICAYKTDDGNRCAVGVFIPDGHAAERAEMQASTLFLEYPDLANILPLASVGLNKLQSVHDTQVNGGDTTTDPRPALLAWVEANVEDAA